MPFGLPIHVNWDWKGKKKKKKEKKKATEKNFVPVCSMSRGTHRRVSN